MSMPVYVDVEVEPGEAAPDGIQLRFKPAGEAHPITQVAYETEDGVAGWWHVYAVDDADAHVQRPATAVLVEDSGEGTTRLVIGGAHGLLLVNRDTGRRDRQAYLVLSITSGFA